MWDTTGRTNLTTKKFPRLAVVTYVVIEWLSEGKRTTNELRVWLEETMRTDLNCQKEDWELLLKFTMAAAKRDPIYKNNSVLAMEVESFTAMARTLFFLSIGSLCAAAIVNSNNNSQSSF